MRTLIISDLHLGNGGPYDVFEGGAALPALLDSLEGESVRVLVNGDGVDFLMNDDALELVPETAVEQAKSIAKYPVSAAVFTALGRVLARGGEVTIRLGNHDVELALPAVQEVFRAALAVPPDVAARLRFDDGDTPEVLEIGGARVLVTHGEQNDDWNRIDYEKLRKGKGYEYAPGSVLVKKILNPGVKNYKMRFLSLLKPDFQGAALSALAVDPMVAKEILKGASMSMLWQLRRRKNMAFTFDQEEAEPTDRELLEEQLKSAGLDADEMAVLEGMLDDGAIHAFAGEDEGILRQAGAKLARSALGVYANVQRRLTGKEGDEYFELAPSGAEWDEAGRLASKYGAGAVIIGHSHAARWKQEGSLLYANTGTWIGLMRLPTSQSADDEWIAFLDELRRNKELTTAAQKLARIETKFTAVFVDSHPDGGAAVSLVEWLDGKLETLQAGRVPPAAL
jgi:UDP-2,3-diacylglucosamine pyrophosphatase LpxH